MPDPRFSILLTVLLAIYQIAMMCWFGDVIARRLFHSSPVKARFPEYAFLIGSAAYAMAGYFLLALTGTARSIAFGELAICIGLEIHLRNRPAAPPATKPAGFDWYFSFRRSRFGKAAIALALLMCLAIGLTRFPWLAQSRPGMSAGMAAIGTRVWDDMRTVGFPIVLAAEGYPLRSPYTTPVVLPYGLGAFIFTAAHIALFPVLALPLVIVDSMLETAFYGIVVLIAAAYAARSSSSRMTPFLVTASGLTSVSYNLWRLRPDVNAPWFEYLYGYYKINGLATTLAWTPFTGILWNSNHGLGLAALVFAVILFMNALAGRDKLSPGEFALSTLFGCYASVTSMDMAAMGLPAIALIMLTAAWRRLAAAPWLRQAIVAWLAAAFFLVAVNLSSLIKEVDSRIGVFNIVTTARYNLGIFLSNFGPYIGLVVLGCILLRRSFLKTVAFYSIPIVTGIAFFFIFEWNLNWLWRAALALHLLFGLIVGRLAAAIHSVYSKQRVYFGVFMAAWALALLPGLSQTAFDARLSFYGIVPEIPRERAEAARWIYAHTGLRDRVVAFRNEQESLAPDVNYLRTGNRAGKQPFDRLHSMIGYDRYLESMSDLLHGIAANDFIVYYRDRPEFAGILAGCEAPVVFENSAAQIFHVDSRCRSRLSTASVQERLTLYHSARERTNQLIELANRAGGPLNLPDVELQKYLIENPETAAGVLRQRATRFWDKNQFAEAVQFLEPVVARLPQCAEGHYSLGISYINSGQNLRLAIDHFTKALDLGYLEFWVRYNRGAAYRALGETDKARADLVRAHDLDSANPGVRALLNSLK